MDEMKWALRIMIVVVCLIGLIVCLYWFLEQRAPFKVANEFIDAIQSKDWDTVMKFIHLTEKEKLSLNFE